MGDTYQVQKKKKKYKVNNIILVDATALMLAVARLDWTTGLTDISLKITLQGWLKNSTNNSSNAAAQVQDP